jgi:hypothetical protein
MSAHPPRVTKFGPIGRYSHVTKSKLPEVNKQTSGRDKFRVWLRNNPPTSFAKDCAERKKPKQKCLDRPSLPISWTPIPRDPSWVWPSAPLVQSCNHGYDPDDN